jgi:hypothetical protein
MGPGDVNTFQFGDDGKLVVVMKFQSSTHGATLAMDATTDLTYTLQDKTILTAPVSVKVNRYDAGGRPATPEKIEEVRADMMDSATRSTRILIKSIDKATLVLQSPDGQSELKCWR